MRGVHNIADDGAAQIDRMYVSCNRLSVYRDTDPIPDLKGLENGQNESMYNVCQPLLEYKTQNYHNQRRRHQNLACKT